MIAYYIEKEKECEFCDGELYPGYEAIGYDGMLFHNKECLIDWFNENAPIEYYELTNDRRYKNE